jgi:hypothetical protein
LAAKQRNTEKRENTPKTQTIKQYFGEISVSKNSRKTTRTRPG